MVTGVQTPVMENVILPRVKSMQKLALTSGINTKKLCAFCLTLSLCAFVATFIKTSGPTVALYELNAQAKQPRFSSPVSTMTNSRNSFKRHNTSQLQLKRDDTRQMKQLNASAQHDFAPISDHVKSNGLTNEVSIPKSQAVMDNVTRFLITDTGKWVTLTFNSCGGLANMIFRFASIYGIARKTGRRPFIEHERICWKFTMPELAASLPELHKATIFQQPDSNSTKRVTYGVNCCRYDNVSRLTTFYSKYKYVFLRGNLLQSYKYFHDFKPEIRQIVEFSPPLREYVKRYADALYGNDTGHKVCIHTRLGDFKTHFLLESRLEFVNPAIRLVGLELNARFPDRNFSAVLIGQDREFLKTIYIPHLSFKTKYMVENLNRAEEIYFGSAKCDSLLLTASGSTFGWWMGYLIPEERQDQVYYNIQASKDLKFGKDVYDFDSFPPEWRRLRLRTDGRVVREPRWRYQIETDRERKEVESGSPKSDVLLAKVSKLIENNKRAGAKEIKRTVEVDGLEKTLRVDQMNKDLGFDIKASEV